MILKLFWFMRFCTGTQWSYYVLVVLSLEYPGFINGGGGGEEGGGFSPSHGREIFENSGMKLAFSCTLKAIIKGGGYVKIIIYQCPTAPLLKFPLLQSTGGGGGMGPSAP